MSKPFSANTLRPTLSSCSRRSLPDMRDVRVRGASFSVMAGGSHIDQAPGRRSWRRAAADRARPGPRAPRGRVRDAGAWRTCPAEGARGPPAGRQYRAAPAAPPAPFGARWGRWDGPEDAIRHGVIGNTSDFGSEVSGSSPDGGTPIALAVMTQDDRGDAACPSRRRPRGAPVVGIEETTAPAAVIVLAAGAGTRMKSRRPKVLHEIGGRSLLVHAVTAAEGTGPA